jgi:hypothetical protein
MVCAVLCRFTLHFTLYGFFLDIVDVGFHYYGGVAFHLVGDVPLNIQFECGGVVIEGLLTT